MNHQDIKRSFEARQTAVHSLRELGDEVRGREMTAEEQETFDRNNSEIDVLDGAIDEGLRQLARDEKSAKALDEFRSYGDLSILPDSVVEDGRVDEAELFRQLANNEIRSFESLASERRDLTAGTGSAGGFTVQSTMYDRIMAKLEASSQILGAGVTVVNTTSGEDLLIPKTTTNTAGALVAEGAAYAEADPVFAQVTLGAYKYGNLVQASQELLSDSAFDVQGFLADTGGAGIGRAFAQDVAAGSGSSRPKGIAEATTSFGTSASATTITAANIFEVWSTMPTQYRTPETKWIMSPGAEKLIRLLVDSNGQYIWSPGLVAGTPANLIGYEVVTDSYIDAPTSGKKALLFCHMPSFFVRIAGGVDVATSADYAFNQGLVTFRFTLRADCDGVDDAGLGRLTQAA
jgi:HK97 family phage major capsid protein